MMMRISRGILAALAAINVAGCGLLAPLCLSKQKRTPVTTITGVAVASSVGFHRVAYGRAGSQNDIVIRWTGRSDPTPPLLRIYATRIECEHFDPSQPAPPRGDACAQVGARIVNPLTPSLIITHGRGNPEQLGPTAEYKLWIVGDPSLAAAYRIDITAFYGPDC